MARLKGLPSRLMPVAPLIAALPKQAEGFYQSAEWRRFVTRLKVERGNYCQRCGATGRIIGDHIVERKDGGADLDPDNVQLLCIRCHNRKTAAARAARASSGGR